ncbi:MAG: hypothetical protein ACO3LT_07380 [Ilumatobacteraceae bacterium]
MTLDNAMFLCAGVLVNGLVFALGIAVGLTLRKDADDDRDNDEAQEEPGNWHLDLDVGTPHRPDLRTAGGAGQEPKADFAKRAPL